MQEYTGYDLTQFVKFEDVKHITPEEYFRGNQLSISTFKNKYLIQELGEQTPAEVFWRVATYASLTEKDPGEREYWRVRWFHEMWSGMWMAAGSILQGSANPKKKVSLINCFARETEFITDKGVKSFNDFNENDKVNILDNHGSWKPATVKQFGVQKLYKLLLSRNGIEKEILVTNDHLWRVKSNAGTIVEIKTKDLKKDDKIPYVTEKKDNEDNQNNQDWKVVSISETDREEVVWCVEVPEVENFTLADGVNTHNCTTINIEKDNLESIFNASYQVAKVAAYRQGLGVKFDLRPVGAVVNNSSNNSLGNTHWMKYMNNIGHYVGQKGRIPAMLFAMPDSNPDLIEFITVKSDRKTIENANISVHFSDAFMEAVESDSVWTMEYVVEDTGEKITRKEKAADIFNMFAVNNHAWAEPGAQFIDTIRKYSNSDYLGDDRWKVKGSNACCVTGDTLIKTDKGSIAIKDLHDRIQSGEIIQALSYNETNQEFEYEVITNSWQQRNDVTIFLTFKGNTSGNIYDLECSLDHPIYTYNRGYVKAKDINVTDDFCMYNDRDNLNEKANLIDRIEMSEIKPLYDIEVNKNHNFLANGVTVHNSEQFLEYVYKKSAGVCFLSSVNFMYLYRMFGNDIDRANTFLRHIVAPSIHRFVDNLITREVEDKRYPIEEQKESLINLRRMGIGITNLDGYLIYNGIGYDTDKGVDTIFSLADNLNLGLYESSIKLGKERGSFKAFKKENYIQSPFVKQMMERHGLNFDHMRNVCLTSIAPTGSLTSMFVDFISYGIEPIMGLYFWKRHRTSGKWQWTFNVMPFVREILATKGVDLGMDSDSVEDDDNGSVGERIAAIIDEHFPKDMFKPAHHIDPFKKIDLMSRLTKYCVDSSISVTYNLPHDVSISNVKEIYMEAWRKGIKSISIYRDKSRQAVVEFESPRIVNKRYLEEEKESVKENTRVLLESKKRPDSLSSDVYHLTVRGEKWIAFVGKNDDGTPVEIFAGKEEELSIPKKYVGGNIVKKGKGKYFFISGEGDEQIKVSITDSFKNDEHSALTRQISLELRFGIPLVYIIDQLEKSNGTVVDFAKVLMRVLKNYLVEEDAIGVIKCKDCGSSNLSYQEKCFVCLDCGSSKCG